MQLISVQILTAWLTVRDQLHEAYVHVRDDERGELTGNVILLAALAVAAAAAGVFIATRINDHSQKIP